jgi:hypothetical protein
LVRVADVVRRELGAPITAERRERLRQQVSDNLEQVQQILRDRAAQVGDLPPPSQRAYHFLASLEWSRVATAEPAAAPEAPRAMLSWRGLGAFMERTMGRLAAANDERELPSIVDTISRTSRQIELTIQRRNVSPDGLSAATRDQRGWLGFFSREENVLAYWQARKLASRVLDAAAIGSRHYPPPLAIHFCPLHGIYKLRAARSGPLLRLPTPMIAFDEAGFSQLAALVFDRGNDSRQHVIVQMTGDGYQAVRAELEALGGVVEQVRGAAHDLGESFDRVNAGYFRGEMPRPRLTWNRTFTGRKFGHYDWIRDTVMVSRTLDSARVPAFVVDFLVFHELLHKFHGLHWVNGRGYAHTTEFQQSERKFAQYEEAEAWLKKLAREVR